MHTSLIMKFRKLFTATAPPSLPNTTTNKGAPTIISASAQQCKAAPSALPEAQISPQTTKVPTTTVLSKILPLAAFSVAFSIVMTVLVLYMDNTAMRHYQFRVNMSQDVEVPIPQDNQDLITYIKEVHLRSAVEAHHEPLQYTALLPPADTAYVIHILNNKRDGLFVEGGAYNDNKTSKTEWLEKKLHWKGLLIQADTRRFFSLRRHNRRRSQAVHACLSTLPYPKEVTFHHQETENGMVKLHHIHANSIVDEQPEPEWFATRIKCFPLFSLLLAMNNTSVDYLSLEASGTELQVLETLPFDRVNIKVIGVHLESTDFDKDSIKKFLAMKDYTLMQTFNNSYIFMLSRLKY